MRPSLDAVAGLQGSLQQVAALEPQLAAVAGLEPAMKELGGLRAPLERVGALEQPMARLATLVSLFDRPMRFVIWGIAALIAWGLVTFVAVRSAIVSARRSIGAGHTAPTI